MSNKIRDKQKRQRLSLQNQSLVRNQLNLVIDNIKKEEEAKVNKEEDPLKYFSQQLREKEKEKEKLKYLKTIKEEDDPLKYFEQKEKKEEKELDPLKFVKENEEINDNNEPKVLGNLALHDEEKLAEAIKNNDIPEEIIINKQEKKEMKVEDKHIKMHKRMKTSIKLSSEGGLAKRINEKLLQRLKNAIKTVNDGEASKITESTKDTGNTLLGAEAQINPNNVHSTKQIKQIDLSAFMQK